MKFRMSINNICCRVNMHKKTDIFRYRFLRRHSRFNIAYYKTPLKFDLFTLLFCFLHFELLLSLNNVTEIHQVERSYTSTSPHPLVPYRLEYLFLCGWLFCRNPVFCSVACRFFRILQIPYWPKMCLKQFQLLRFRAPTR